LVPAAAQVTYLTPVISMNYLLSVQSLVPWITNRHHFLVAHSPFYSFSRVFTWWTWNHKWSVHYLHSVL